MAILAKRLAANVRGEFFVDSTCIDCGTCRQVAPDSFAEGDDASYVYRQPVDEAAAKRAAMALVACPVAAIGTEKKRDVAAARAAFPEPIADGVYYCGWAAESSFGARSYLVVRPRGNILIDSPRYAAPLVDAIEALGGVRWMFLSHGDDVADHATFRERFGCERIMHVADATFAPERPIEIAEATPVRSTTKSSSFRCRGIRRDRRACSIAGGFLFRATTRGRTPRASASSPRAASAGTTGISRLRRWRGSPTTASSGCCPGTACVAGCRRSACARKCSAAWRA
jgi:ferredoxin